MTRRLALLTVLSPFLMGQMCGAPAPTPGRLDVTDTLRVACAGYTPTDADIDALLSGIEADRLNGITWEQNVGLFVNVCSQFGPQINIMCNRCGSAVLNQVYGR